MLNDKQIQEVIARHGTCYAYVVRGRRIYHAYRSGVSPKYIGSLYTLRTMSAEELSAYTEAKLAKKIAEVAK